ncbi:MAG: TIGR03560 family F420-dependent LLM class oxidoreductase [Candidatus Limnocylindrales bacterium]
MSTFFGYHMPNYTFPDLPPERLFERTIELAQAAEAAGFDLVTVMDHFHQIAAVGLETEPMLEAYTTLGALAVSTHRVLLGAMVTGVTYRNPAMLAKQVATLDTISKGRAVLGLGAAWNESEHHAYGWDFPPIGERMDRLGEALEICRRMLRGDERTAFEGEYYTVDGALNIPRPVRPGGPPVVIGGGGERRTLRFVAQYADIWNVFGPLDDLRRKNGLLDRYCEEAGRDPASITRTAMVPLILARDEAAGAAILETVSPERRGLTLVGTLAQAMEILGRYLDAGFDGFVLRNVNLPTPEAVSLAGELIRAMR